MPRSILCLLTLTALLSFSPGAKCRSSGTGKRAAAPLSAKLTILSQRYCRSSQNDTLCIKCQIKFVNTGQARLILDKRCGTIGSMRIVEKSTKPNSRPLEVISGVEIDHLGYTGEDRNTPNPGRGEFIFLDRGESFTTQGEIKISAERGDKHFNSIFGPGEYLITAEVETWIGSDEMGAALQRRWKKWGRLWYLGVTSEPLLVTVAENPKIEDCSGKD